MNFFKWKQSLNASSVEVAEEQVTKPVTVAEIHETFFTEVDRLLEEAGIKTIVEIEDKKAFETGKTLHDLGFTSSLPAREYKITQEDLEKAKQENDEKEALKEDIMYFSQKYPLYRFITETSVKKICDKYGLIYGDVAHYKGDVPEKNIKEIALAETAIKDEDIAYSHQSMRTFERSYRHLRYISYEEYCAYWKGRDRISESRAIKTSLSIAAPATDFNLDGMHVDSYQIKHNIPKVEDPIVLRRVFRNWRTYFLIVSAWGEEAGDPEVTNKIFN